MATANVTTNESTLCQMARDLISNGYVQSCRILLLTLVSVQVWLTILVVIEYKRRRVPLHGNLKILYGSLTGLYFFQAMSILIIELSNLFSAIVFALQPRGGTNCPLLLPLWYTLLFRGVNFFYSFALGPFHIAIMVERLRATLNIENYEYEGLKYGKYAVGIILPYALLLSIFLQYLFLKDHNFNYGEPGITTMTTTKSPISSILFQYLLYSCLCSICITALGDFWIYWKNRRLLAHANKFIPKRVPAYNLSEKYQMVENRRAMNLIFPLDLLFLVFALMSNALAIGNTIAKPFIQYAIYEALMEIVLAIMVIYMIISLAFIRRFLRINLNENRFNSKRVVPFEEVARVHFDSMRKQWNTVALRNDQNI